MSKFDEAEDEGALRFEMPDNYDPDAEYDNTIGKGKRKNMSKDDHIYGMWNDDDDDGGGGGRRGFGGAAPDYSKPMSFVSTGEKTGSDPTDAARDDEDDNDDDHRTGFAIGSAARDGLGVRMPTSFGSTRTKKSTPFVRGDKKPEVQAGRAADPTRFAGDAEANVDKDFGSWEAHTKGLGMKMLEKMGYKKGDGLGIRGKGMAEPVQVKLRPKNLGIAAGGFKEKVITKDEIVKQQEEARKKKEEVAVRNKSEQAWRVGSKASKRKVTYKTADEVREELSEQSGGGGGAAAAPANQTVIDMRGPQTKIASLSSLGEADDLSSGSSRNCVELQHNVKRLIDLSEMEIVQLDRKLGAEKERQRALGAEIKKAGARLSASSTEIARLQEVAAIVESCVQAY